MKRAREISKMLVRSWTRFQHQAEGIRVGRHGQRRRPYPRQFWQIRNAKRRKA